MGAVAILAVVILLVVHFVSKKQTYQNKNEGNLVAVADTQNFYQKDSDGDGIYDWEEGLWGTDPNNKDTNGDGVSDGDEIKAQKEQIKKNNSNLTTDSTDDKNLNQTEIFARQLFSAASLAKQQGGLTPEALESFSNSFGSSIANSQIADPFSLKDIKLDNVSPQTYKADLAKAYGPYMQAQISGPESIYNYSQGDKTSKDKIIKLSQLYKDMSNSLLKVTTPYSAAGIELSMANNAAKLSIAFLNMINLEDDPVLAVVGFHQYEVYSVEMEKALDSLKNYFTSNGIIN